MKTVKLKATLSAETKSIIATQMPHVSGHVEGVFVTIADPTKLPNDIVELNLTDSNSAPIVSMDIREYKRQGGCFSESYFPLNIPAQNFKIDVNTATPPTTDVVFEVVLVIKPTC